MIKAFSIMLLIIMALAAVATLADGKRFREYLLIFVSSGSLFLIGVLINGIISKL